MRLTEQVFQLHKVSTEAATAVNFAAIEAENPWVRHFAHEVKGILQANASKKSKYGQFQKLADRLNQAVMPHAACSRGCSHCCNIAVMSFPFEAERIGQHIGRAPQALTGIPDSPEAAVDAHNGEPCPFLKDHQCSIYEVRPLACRMHANIGDSPFFCDTSIPSEQTIVPSLDANAFWQGVVVTFGIDAHRDLREFFP